MRINQKWLLSGFAFCALFAAAASCTRDEVESSTTDKVESRAFDQPETTYLGKAAESLSAGHGGESGFLLMDRGRDALAWRTILADAAEQSIDAQYFLWKDDAAGKVMMQRLLAAADRGVRVRVLIDDSMTESDPQYLALFGAHPKVELRLYKPFGPKHKSLVMRWIDYVADLRVLNRRMHNKLFVVDDSVAIIGGRNIGNEYFEYSGPFVNRSRDLLALGPVVEPASEAFDRYWNSDWTVPIEDVVTPVPTPAEAKQQQEHLDVFAADTSHYPPGFYDNPEEIDSEMRKLGEALLWGAARLLVDAVPEKGGKAQTRAELDKTGFTLAHIAKKSSDEILIQSAYLVLLDGGFEAFSAMTNRGVTVKLATNSMASNNHLTAFVGYAKQRHRLLETGAELYEMRPDAKSERALFTAAQLEAHETLFGLHAKTSVFDRKITFVGSFNVDPRSVNLNTEMGLLVESEALANAVAASIENDIAAGNSWQVILKDDDKLAWIAVESGVISTETDEEPMTSAARRTEAEALAIVPDDAQL
ncbi:MAG: phospholipase D family protein [Deltaproteobacteria bacterium]|nr:phospholipase D family protein [Deltaproteobacteria bacterium]MBW2692765.1 phospholipase D family protein [Deltaproteobacteria bacterium]